MKQLEWFNCYSNGWNKDDIVPAAFSHPAKFAKQLIRRIYDHLLTEGYIRAGDVIADPFGGVALGAFWAMRNGLHWRGVELEAKFVELGQANIDLWTGRYAAHFPAWGTAQIYRGDSRELSMVLSGAGCVMSSPPYAGSLQPETADQTERKQQRIAKAKSIYDGRNMESPSPGKAAIGGGYGFTPGQLGSMPEGTAPAAIVASPPFADTVQHSGGPAHQKGGTLHSDYGSTPGQLGSMKEGDVSAVISSPPYSDAISGNGEGPGARHDFTYHNGENATKNSSANGYGLTEGNLGNLAAVVSSPPFESSLSSTDMDFIRNRLTTGPAGSTKLRGPNGAQSDGQIYGTSEGNIGNDQGDTFWTAAQTILTQCYQILAPGGVAVWVSGDFVRDGKRVEFGKQWLALCESVGFVGLEHITAWKTEPGPVQSGIFDDRNLTIDRVSFFRRLSINRAMAAEHWTVIDGETQAGYLTAAYSVLWQAYETGQTPPDQIVEPELPSNPTIDSLRQYQQDLREYKRLAAATGTGNKPPTKRRILDYAQMVAWKDNGAESFDVDSAILSEDVWIVQKPR